VAVITFHDISEKDEIFDMKIVKDMATGMTYLHANGMIHRDLKYPNVLLDENRRAVIAYFGTSLITQIQRNKELGGCYIGLAFSHSIIGLTRTQCNNMTSNAGTCRWIAPEVIQGNEYSFKADIYSWGHDPL